MRAIILTSAALLMAAACQSTGDDQSASANGTEIADAEPDVRQGEEVSRICFSSQIRGWREHGDKAVIVEKGVREEFLIELIGTCRPDDAFLQIGLVSRSGFNCLTRGDTLLTDDSLGGRCTIRRMYEWNEDAGEEATPESNES